MRCMWRCLWRCLWRVCGKWEDATDGGAADSDTVEAGATDTGEHAAADPTTSDEHGEESVAASAEGDKGAGATDGGVEGATDGGVEGGLASDIQRGQRFVFLCLFDVVVCFLCLEPFLLTPANLNETKRSNKKRNKAKQRNVMHMRDMRQRNHTETLLHPLNLRNFDQAHWVVVLVSAPFSSAAETSWVCSKKSRWGSFGKDLAKVMSRAGPSAKSYMANKLWTVSLTVMISLAADSTTWKIFG